jgi:hypothetical protein
MRMTTSIKLAASVLGTALLVLYASRVAAEMDDPWARNAGFMYDMAVSCHESKEITDRFEERVFRLTRLSADEWEFVGGMTCGLYEHHCPNPYAKMRCGRFLAKFRGMRINRSDWQPAHGFR